MNNFNNYNLCDEILKSLDFLGYEKPTKVQQETIPEILNGRDVLVKSKTGSGKTASFVIPVLNKVVWEEKYAQALILTPTRELAIQIKEDVVNIGRFKRIKCSSLFGRDSFIKQTLELKQKTHVVVGTPGRVLDHLEKGTFNTSNIKYLIIDEADEMLDMGFLDQVHQIIEDLPKERVTVLLSATVDAHLRKITDDYMISPKTIEIEEAVSSEINITQTFYKAFEDSKKQDLKNLTIMHNPDSCIIFCNTQAKVDEVTKYLFDNNYTVKKIHGGMEQSDRTEVMNKFKRGVFRYLVATDVAGRGIDISDISLVINYDMPKKVQNYVHRIGRTGRNEKTGQAITFVTNIGQTSFENLCDFLNVDHTLNDMITHEDIANKIDDFNQKNMKAPEIKVQKSDKLNKDITKLHINAGKKTKMRAFDVVGTICSLDGLVGADIGVINIAEVSTFFEILNGKGEQVYKELQNTPIKGRIRKVSYVE